MEDKEHEFPREVSHKEFEAMTPEEQVCYLRNKSEIFLILLHLNTGVIKDVQEFIDRGYAERFADLAAGKPVKPMNWGDISELVKRTMTKVKSII